MQSTDFRDWYVLKLQLDIFLSCVAGPVLHLPCTLKHSPNSEVFLFPDEDEDDAFQDLDTRPQPMSRPPASLQPQPPQQQQAQFPQMVAQHFDGDVSEELGSNGSDFFNDDDFCVLDDPGMGVLVSREFGCRMKIYRQFIFHIFSI